MYTCRDLDQNYLLTTNQHMQLNRSKTLILPNEDYQDEHVEPSCKEDLKDSLDKEGQGKEKKNVHQFILSEFKQKYDQLNSKFEVKKKEADTLLYEKKKLEIELLNHNVEYYDKQIVRLRTEAEKYQLENVEIKHKYLVAQNTRNDVQAAAKLKEDEFKKMLKQLENEKIMVVELKHQLALKDKQFASIIADVEKANQDISQKYEKANQGLNKADNELKVKIGEMEVMKKLIENHSKEIQQKNRAFGGEAQKQELNEYRFKNRIGDLQEEVQVLKRKQNQKIRQLEAKVKQLEDEKISQEYFLVQKNESADFTRQIRVMEHEIAVFEEKSRQSEIVNEAKNRKIELLESKLRKVCSIDLLHQSEENYIEKIKKHQITQRYLENQTADLQKELEHQKLKSKAPSGNLFYYQNEAKGKVNFQDLLKSQIEQNNRLKLELSYKIDEVFALKNTIEEQNVKQSLLENQIDILHKKQKAEEKNSKINFEIQSQNLRNEVDSLKRKVQVTQQKLSIKGKEAKDKDSFITNIIISRSRQEDVPFVVAELKRIFEAQYVDKLNQAHLKIVDLQSKAVCR